ncbi:hypothetical protein EPR50_G00241300 [Perca flavescens]|uniref:L27 domain-containing protein n=1 Tax=Perca flavescens TaxID=8167 RepID=A0A484BYS6_PERFV|nr:hypothetical protein EPR50_G00241300 [Perca flavescens]
MRQAVEAQVLSPHCELGEHGLRQILTDVIAEVRKSVNPDLDGAEILHGLLNSSWLQSLLKVYECLQRYLRDSPAPALDYASGLSLQLLVDIRALPGCSEDANELYRLLRQPHLQALLSAHDTVAQKDYEPVLPPMPEELPDDEEATRIICLVKNKQPLLRDHQRVEPPLPSAPSPWPKSSRGGVHSHWDTLRRLTQQRLRRGGAFGIRSPAAAVCLDSNNSLWCSARRGSFPPTEPPCHAAAAAARPCPPPRRKPTSQCVMCCSESMRRCRVCYSGLLWEQSLNRSAPSVYSSCLFVGDNVIEELDGGDEDEAGESSNAQSPLPTAPRRWTMSPPCLTVPYYPNAGHYLPPGLPPGFPSQSPRIRTAPPSPMRPRRGVDLPPVPPVELAKQESLDELRMTVQLAACSMENSTKDIKLLGETMAAATEHMSETVRDNSQALALLAQVVDRLQTLLGPATRTESNALTPAGRDGTPENSQSPKSRGQPSPSPTHRSTCSFPSLPSSTSSSSSLSSSLDPSTSRGTSCQSASCRGSPQITLKTKNALSPQKKHAELRVSKHLLTNGLPDEPKDTSHTVKWGRSNQRKKWKKKKKAT